MLLSMFIEIISKSSNLTGKLCFPKLEHGSSRRENISIAKFLFIKGMNLPIHPPKMDIASSINERKLS